MQRSHLNLVLIATIAGLGAAVYFSQEKPEKHLPLSALTAEAVNRIVIEHPGRPRIALEKAGAQWRITEPVKVDADALEVANLTSLAALERKSTVATDANKADLGLSPAKYQITLNQQTLEFGDVEPLSAQRYIATEGGIVTVEDPPETALDADYSDLVSKQLLPEDAEITGITLKGLSLTRAADGKGWNLTPDTPAASSDQKQRLVDGWKSARAMWNAAELPEGSTGDEVVIQLKDASLKFIVAAREPQLILVRPDLKVRYTLSKELEPELLQLPAEAKPKETAQ